MSHHDRIGINVVLATKRSVCWGCEEVVEVGHQIGWMDLNGHPASKSWLCAPCLLRLVTRGLQKLGSIQEWRGHADLRAALAELLGPDVERIMDQADDRTRGDYVRQAMGMQARSSALAPTP